MIARTEFVRRRKRLMALAGKHSSIIVASAPPRARSNDAFYRYRQDSDLAYLTGFSEADAVLVLVPGRSAGEAILFCRERERERERWEGELLGIERAPAVLKVDHAFPIEDIDEILPGLIEGRERVYYAFGRDPEFDGRVLGWIHRLQGPQRRPARAPESIVALGHLLHEQRLIKSKGEIRLLREAADISCAAHVRVMRVCRPGLSENQIEAEILHTFHSRRAVAAYEPSVAAGVSACILHYRRNRGALKNGELLLVDAGAEVECYASDITRTIPINGRFSPAQRELYQLVLEAQLAAIAAARPGLPWSGIHDAAVQVIARGLVALGLIKGSVKQCLKKHSYTRYFMHKTGHWLGMDVHDVGDYRIDGASRLLEAGMVLTVEPGIYVPADARYVPEQFRGIGIRIEDEVLVTKGDPEVLTEKVPKTILEIEATMRAPLCN